ncbi:MAG: hypothetical protein K9W45_05730 [Candidatus Heimdallarchaeum aukensis]|uniref:PKD domain-containing protein n=1 Tax=Candidatus Heimdallarchaeum aukensis TaxID=2876573 RepID=A0A9Y1BN03_9ARCH|nr:MAG: hypothetical protein K9W45_05730 [Candidatus Heimdallarchaeum aukensis]
MNKRKEGTLILVLVISLSMMVVFNQTIKISANNVPAPKLKEYTPAGFSIENGTLITVNYTVPRFAGIDGVFLVGEGSGLTTDLNSALALNYSHSYRDLSYYSGVFNLTENTKFKGYAWSGEITNGTYEDLPVFNHMDAWHYIYARNSIHPPYLDEDIISLPKVGTNAFLAELNQTITLKYIVRNGNPADKVTLALSVYRDRISNANLTNYEGVTFLEMDYETNDTGTGFPVYTISFNLTERMIYFAANNSAGWDLNAETGELQIYRLQNGFNFESYPEESDYYTDIDDVIVILQTLNETKNDEFGISYKVEESETNRTEIVPLTDLTNGVLINETNVTNSDGWNDTIREYRFNLGKFNVGNVVYFRAFNLYYGEQYNETEGEFHELQIYDSKPKLTLLPRSQTYFNYNTITFNYTIQLAKGDISEIFFNFGDGNTENITDFEKMSTVHSFANESEVYNVSLYVETTLGTSENISSLIYIDLENPTLSIDPKSTNTSISKSTDGYVELFFNYEDNFGVAYVYIDWGDGTVWNATNSYSAAHQYISSGDFEAKITVTDKAGNNYTVSVIFSIELQEETTQTTPFAWTFSIFALSVIIFFWKKKR